MNPKISSGPVPEALTQIEKNFPGNGPFQAKLAEGWSTESIPKRSNGRELPAFRSLEKRAAPAGLPVKLAWCKV